jgi:hypothetical protein
MVPEPAPLDPDSPAARTAPLSPTPAVSAIEKPAVPPFSPRVRRISLYYAGREDLTTAQSLAKHLQTTGHSPPFLEQVAYTGGGNLRYFHPSDRSLASDIAADARAFFKQTPSGDPGTFRLISMARSHPDVAPGLIEIWLPATGTRGGRAKKEPTRSSTAAPPPSTAHLSDIDPAASLADARRRLEDTKRLNRFLDAYCRSYEAKDLAAFRRFFLPDATENGQPFDSLLPVYRRNLELIQQMEYRINVDRYEKAGADLDWRIEGTFHARCILTTSDVRETRGYIRLEVVPQAGSFRVKRLDYRLTAQ